MRSLGLEHSCPSALILYSRLNGNLELLGDFEREIDVSEEFPGEEDDVCFVCLEDFVGLSGFGDESDGADLAGGRVRFEDMKRG
jgi:hypothetical protein